MSRFVLDIPDAEKEKQKCLDFLTDYQDYAGAFKYVDMLKHIANRETKVLKVELDDVLEFSKGDPEFISNIIQNTTRYVRHFEACADRLMPPPTEGFGTPSDVFDILQAQRLNQLREGAAPGGPPVVSDTPDSLVRKFEVVILPRVLDIPKKLREVKSEDIGHLIKLRGMVTRASDVKPQLTVCTYTCEVCGSEIFQEIAGAHMMPIQLCPSQRCVDNKTGGRVLMQTRGSRFVKYQELRVQELPDQVPVGHIPRCVTIHCRGEQTRLCGPGDIIQLSGVFMTVKYRGFRAIKAGLQADTYIEAFDIKKEKLSFNEIGANSELNDEARRLTNDPDVYGTLASSIAPEIFGHEDVKKALLLQLVAGSTRTLPDGMKIRGDINICLMGDPGVAKSQLLKYVASVAPRGVYTTGKGSSGVGLTAAVIRDPLTGDLSLEGGALVLADMGVCCIDEFDKMDNSDRTAIHEVMEQQTISIAKAGITTTLNARAAVLAAANPLFGRYNIRKSISDNVDLPNSLLSRFDLLFLILDRADNQKDLALSKHVLFVHRYGKNPIKKDQTAVTPKAFKEYVAAARTLNPIIPKELTTFIVEQYVNMRKNDVLASQGSGRSRNGSNQAVMTARQLLSILRLGQSLARLRLSGFVSMEDVEEAIRLTYASKASLHDESATGVQRDDVLSAIFLVIKDFVSSRGTDEVGYTTVEAMVTKKGFSSVHLEQCLQEYQSLGVLTLSSDKSMIYFDQGMLGQ